MKLIYSVASLLIVSLLSACGDVSDDPEAYNRPRHVNPNIAAPSNTGLHYEPFETTNYPGQVGVAPPSTTSSYSEALDPQDDVYPERTSAGVGTARLPEPEVARLVPHVKTKAIAKPKSRPREEPGVWSGAPPSTTAH